MQNDVTEPTWPPHGVESLPWRQQVRGGTREDRMFTSVDATIPPRIKALDYVPPLAVLLKTEKALLAVARADTDAEGHSAALSRFMMRSESVASSKIERITATAVDYAKAIAGSRGNAAAVSMVAASTALHELITTVSERGRFELEHVTSAHSALMADDPHEADYAGRLRDVQNWIGGSDYSPRDALHVPPAPERVPELMADLVAYLNRDDVPVMVQAAIGHAQFESIHAFTDGNGRIGRLLMVLHCLEAGFPPIIVEDARKQTYYETLEHAQRKSDGPFILFLVEEMERTNKVLLRYL